uniref:Zinc finger HIT domain-containing protein n=1 Tax=Fundulus heteroclitus TaxID=8078 RepID=A0A3Q2T2Q0_FUNHE
FRLCGVCRMGCGPVHARVCGHTGASGVLGGPGPVELVGGVDNVLCEDDIIDKVPLHRLQSLGNDPILRFSGENVSLFFLLVSFLYCAESKEAAMKAAMQEPLFVEFADQCLKVIENEGDNHEDGSCVMF